MDKKLQTAAQKMGYRHMGRGVWAKPVAHHLLTVHEVGGVAIFKNYFVGVQDQLLLWSAGDLKSSGSGGYEAAIKDAEYGTRFNVGLPVRSSDFGFLTKVEMVEAMLDS